MSAAEGMEWLDLLRSQGLALAIALTSYQRLTLHSKRAFKLERAKDERAVSVLKAEHEADKAAVHQTVLEREQRLEKRYDERLRELEESYRARRELLEREWQQRELDLVSTAAATAQAQAQEQLTSPASTCSGLPGDAPHGRKVSTDSVSPLGSYGDRREPSAPPRNFSLASRKPEPGRNISALSSASATSAALDAAVHENRVDALESRLANALSERDHLQEELLLARAGADKAQNLAETERSEMEDRLDRVERMMVQERERRVHMDQVVRGLEGECERYRQQVRTSFSCFYHNDWG